MSDKKNTHSYDKYNASDYWLRNTEANYSTIVIYQSERMGYGMYIDHFEGVRPVIWVDLNSLSI